MIKRIYILFVVLFTYLSCNLAGGSYPYAETYEFQTNPEQVIEAVKRFKTENPSFIVPVSVGLKDGKSERSDDHWYHIYFYDKSENKILSTWIRGGNTATFAFVGVNDGLQLGNWKQINDDFSNAENKKWKGKFEQEILNKVKEYLKL